MKIYIASSLKNYMQTPVASVLRQAGHDVYEVGCLARELETPSWRQIYPDWKKWTPQQYRDALNHPVANATYDVCMEALRQCDACVLVLPSGRSSSWEFGWALGNGKLGAVVMLEQCEPELMYLGNPILTTMDELMDWAGIPKDGPVSRDVGAN